MLAADTLLERTFSAAAGFFGARLVDLFGALGGVGQDRHAVITHLQEAAGDRHVDLLTALDDAHDAGLDHREQRRVLWQHCQLALSAGRHDFLDAFLGEDFSLGGDDVDAKWHVLPPEPGSDRT